MGIKYKELLPNLNDQRPRLMIVLTTMMMMRKKEQRYDNDDDEDNDDDDDDDDDTDNDDNDVFFAPNLRRCQAESNRLANPRTINTRTYRSAPNYQTGNTVRKLASCAFAFRTCLTLLHHPALRCIDPPRNAPSANSAATLMSGIALLRNWGRILLRVSDGEHVHRCKVQTLESLSVRSLTFDSGSTPDGRQVKLLDQLCDICPCLLTSIRALYCS